MAELLGKNAYIETNELIEAMHSMLGRAYTHAEPDKIVGEALY